MPLVSMTLTTRHKAARAAWGVVHNVLFRPSPIVCHGWRRCLLRCFGAKLSRGSRIYPRVRIFAPWNLEMAENSVIGNDVDCYAVARIVIGRESVVSQYSYLCTATHDHRDRDFPLMVGPILIGERAWVAAGAFIAPGIQIGDGAVVGARSVVTRNVMARTVVAGNPARVIGERPDFSATEEKQVAMILE